MSDTPSPAFVAPTLDDAILVVERGVATFTMNRDDVRNELTGTALASDIVKVVDAINNDPSISVLIVTGAGNAFSAGGNVKHMKSREGSFGGDVYTVQNKYRRGIQQIPRLGPAGGSVDRGHQRASDRGWLRSRQYVRHAHRG